MKDCYNKVAFRYAKAFFLHGKEKNMLTQLFDDLDYVYRVLTTQDELTQVIHNVLIHSSKKTAILDSVFSKSISSETMRFIYFLAQKRRLNLLADIFICYQYLFYEENNMLQATITSAIVLEEDQKARITQVLEEKIGKKIVSQFSTMRDLIAGFKINIQDHVVDLSVKTKLQTLKKHMSAA